VAFAARLSIRTSPSDKGRGESSEAQTMTDAVTLRRSYGCLLLALSLSGCAATPVPLVNITGSGEQWVWPFFLQGKRRSLRSGTRTRCSPCGTFQR